MALRMQFICTQTDTTTVELVVPGDTDLTTFDYDLALNRASFPCYSPNAEHTVTFDTTVEIDVDDTEIDI